MPGKIELRFRVRLVFYFEGSYILDTHTQTSGSHSGTLGHDKAEPNTPRAIEEGFPRKHYGTSGYGNLEAYC